MPAKLIRNIYVTDSQEAPAVEWFAGHDEVHADNARDAGRKRGLVITDEFAMPQTEDEVAEFLNQHAILHPSTVLKLGR